MGMMRMVFGNSNCFYSDFALDSSGLASSLSHVIRRQDHRHLEFPRLVKDSCGAAITVKEGEMKYSRFEELPVWKDAIELAVKIYEFTIARHSKVATVLKIRLSALPFRSPTTSRRGLNEARLRRL
jgi:hypothetical protein